MKASNEPVLATAGINEYLNVTVTEYKLISIISIIDRTSLQNMVNIDFMYMVVNLL